MSALEELLAKPPPEELFHYTSQTGLLGILQTRTLWASKISHLNDAEELVLALDLARKQIHSLDADEELAADLLDDVDGMLGGSINIFVFSLAEDGDQLSQWRGYTPLGSGYSIGFPTGPLRAVADRSWRFSLGPCSYDPSVHEQVIAEIIDQAVQRRRSLGQAISHRSPTAVLPFKDALYFAAPFLKHEGFAEEREWRLVSAPISYTNPRFKHRVGASHLVPYLELPLCQSNAEPLPLKRVIVGPTPHPGLAQDAVATLLGSLDLHGWAIESSEIPFRQW